MPIKGAYAELQYLIRQTRAIANKQLLETINENLAEEAIDLIKQGFRDQADPYGRAWAGKKVPDGRAILTGRTGFLKSGWHRTRLSRRGFTVAPSVTYAVYHQTGTQRMVARKMIPDGDLPDRYSRAFAETIIEIIARHFKR